MISYYYIKLYINLLKYIKILINSPYYISTERSNLRSPELHVLKKVPNCSFCGAKRFEHEPPSFCCYNGKVVLYKPEVIPELVYLFTSQNADAVDFRKHIRAYNGVFGFCSLGVTLDEELANATQGVYTFRAQGQIYHKMPPLTPSERHGPVFFQLYFLDTDNELDNRMKKAPWLCEATMQTLMKIMENNPYAQFFRSLKDITHDDWEIRIRTDNNLDQRDFNAPTVDQVAAIWVEGNDHNVPTERAIALQSRSG